MQLHFLVLLLCALYGLVFPVGKLTLEYSSPLFITAARMILAAIILLAYQFLFNRKNFTFKKAHFLPAFVIGFSAVYLSNALEYWGLQFMESGKACFIYSFSPIATAFISYWWFSEKITAQKWAGLLIGILGFIPILVVHSGSEDNSGYLGFFSYAEIAILGAAITSSIGWIAMRHMVKVQQCSFIMANSTSMLMGGVIALGHSFWVETWHPLPISDFWPFLQWFLALTLVSNIICYNLNALLLRTYTATYMSFAGLSQPFFAALFGWILLNEVMSAPFWFSVVAASFGLYIYYQEELRQGHVAHTPISEPAKTLGEP